ncbi:hypothetical protein DUNSADRAFT_13050 [Dunaliella salina]|uniref:C3H1-type domain-containing protein n=1 Tax=Dunaliella salina TaxID=3046 RepID=A0ABZ3KQP4_DUNSA|nr:hypothetical protein DUNSADRAFT_13050 [Dunaliella salina]|eukprot:KAF5831492.1 hypothetical protein DUNSADRAFT_13050 [Dunaliella salina]
MDGAFPSDPASFRGGGSAGFRGTAENAKTKLCNRWMQGDCRFGDRCNFAHGEQELRPLTGGGFDMGGRGAFPGRVRKNGPCNCPPA